MPSSHLTLAASSHAPAEASSTLTITTLTGRIGAEISGVRLAGDLPEAVVAEIRQALLRHKVVFFRGQQHLDEVAHEAFTERLGPLLVHPARKALEGTRATLHLDSEVVRANTWHADLTFMNAFPQLSVLRGVEIPAVGGDTLWANTVTAYEHLPPLLKPFVDQLWAVHSNAFDASTLIPAGSAAGQAFQAAQTQTRIVETEHPVVHVHPETGERALLLGQFVKRLVGFGAADSARLLAILHDHATSHENIVRWRWTQGDVVIWDNRATLHKAVDDCGTQHRVVRRVTASGPPPSAPTAAAAPRAKRPSPRTETRAQAAAGAANAFSQEPPSACRWWAIWPSQTRTWLHPFIAPACRVPGVGCRDRLHGFGSFPGH